MNRIINQKLYYEYTLNGNKAAGYRLSVDKYRKDIQKYAKISFLCIMATLGCLFAKNKFVKVFSKNA